MYIICVCISVYVYIFLSLSLYIYIYLVFTGSMTLYQVLKALLLITCYLIHAWVEPLSSVQETMLSHNDIDRAWRTRRGLFSGWPQLYLRRPTPTTTRNPPGRTAPKHPHRRMAWTMRSWVWPCNHSVTKRRGPLRSWRPESKSQSAYCKYFCIIC